MSTNRKDVPVTIWSDEEKATSAALCAKIARHEARIQRRLKIFLAIIMLVAVLGPGMMYAKTVKSFQPVKYTAVKVHAVKIKHYIYKFKPVKYGGAKKVNISNKNY